ncbi:hypothetical protein JCM3774_001749 [Rhodotorula dairenensis]
MTALVSTPVLLLCCALGALTFAVLAAVALCYGIAARRRSHRNNLLARSGYPDTAHIVAFFHPYCNAGGGGERVLWTALACLQRECAPEKDTLFVVYTGDVGLGKASAEQVLAKAEARFGIKIDSSTIAFVPLRHRWLVEDSTWPRLTLLGQSIGSVLLALEALFGQDGLVPDYWIDTMGYAFTYPVVKYSCRIPVASYTHYPTISTDMLDRVRTRRAGHTNASLVATSRVLSALKLGYYRLFATAYTASLCRADVIWVNSSWTKAHVGSLLGGGGEGRTGTNPGRADPENASRRKKKARRIRLLYPPCDTTHLAQFPLATKERTRAGRGGQVTILSLAQFRPEKEHPTQLRAFAKLLALLPASRSSTTPSTLSLPSGTASHLSLLLPPPREMVRLVLAGSVRGAADSARVETLRRLASELGVADQVEFVVNEPYPVICDLMQRATIGLHTMVDEHFGITVVEFQAAGLIPLAHASAGPLNDIIVPSGDCTGSTGFLAPSSSFSSSASPLGPAECPASSATTFDPHDRTRPPDLAEAYAYELAHILSMPFEQQDEIRTNARENARTRFGTDVFERGWLDGWRDLVAMSSSSRLRGEDEKEE